jgi:bifunctional non-homologous end joining protein LigD
MRVLVDITDGNVRLFARSGRDVTVSFPELTALGDVLPDALLDGEIIALRNGVPSFEALGDRMHVADARKARALAQAQPVTVMVFDLLRLYGVDLRSRPLEDRRKSLAKLDLPEAHWRLSPTYDDGVALFEATREQGLEGVVAKRRHSTYQAGRRSSDWVKTPHHKTLSCLVGGWRSEKTSGSGAIGSLLVGLPGPSGELGYAGRVGSGLSNSDAVQLKKLLTPLTRDGSPFGTDVPALDSRGTTWCEPKVVVDVRFAERTSAGRLRHPVFRGIRADLEPEQVLDEF